MLDESKWEGYYRTYKSLQVSWEWNNVPYQVAKQAFTQVQQVQLQAQEIQI